MANHYHRKRPRLVVTAATELTLLNGVVVQMVAEHSVTPVASTMQNSPADRRKQGSELRIRIDTCSSLCTSDQAIYKCMISAMMGSHSGPLGSLDR